MAKHMKKARSQMDKKEYVEKLEMIMEGNRESLKTTAIAYVIYLSTGQYEMAEWSLREAFMSLWRVTECQDRLQKVKKRIWDGNLEKTIENIERGEAPLEKAMSDFSAARAQRDYREFQTAWRLFATEGVRLGSHLMEQLYALRPDEREKKIRGFSPEASSIKDVDRPCDHDKAPVIPDMWPYSRAESTKVVCTECSQRFTAECGTMGASVTRVEGEGVEQARLVRVIRPFVRD